MVVFTPGFDRNSAFNVFKQNITRTTVLSMDTISCITLIVEAPACNSYTYTRIGLFNQKMTKMIFKFFIIDNNIHMMPWNGPNIRSRRYRGFETATPASFLKEFDYQRDMYYHSIKSNIGFLDAMCPAPLYCEILPMTENFMYLKNTFVGTPEELGILNHFFDRYARLKHKGMIAMEYMNGYRRLSDYLGTPSYPRFHAMHLEKLIELHTRYAHMDYHHGNAMINENKNEYTIQNEPDYLGSSLLIDFGRAVKLNRVKRVDYNKLVNIVNGLYKPNIQYIFDVCLAINRIEGHLFDTTDKPFMYYLITLILHRMIIKSEYSKYVQMTLGTPFDWQYVRNMRGGKNNVTMAQSAIEEFKKNPEIYFPWKHSSELTDMLSQIKKIYGEKSNISSNILSKSMKSKKSRKSRKTLKSRKSLKSRKTLKSRKSIYLN